MAGRGLFPAGSDITKRLSDHHQGPWRPDLVAFLHLKRISYARPSPKNAVISEIKHAKSSLKLEIFANWNYLLPVWLGNACVIM